MSSIVQGGESIAAESEGGGTPALIESDDDAKTSAAESELPTPPWS